MTITIGLFIIIVAVFVIVCCLCVIAVLQSRDKNKQIESRISSFEKELDDMNEAITSIPERINTFTAGNEPARPTVSEQQARPVFRAPQDFPDDDILEDIEDIRETEANYANYNEVNNREAYNNEGTYKEAYNETYNKADNIKPGDIRTGDGNIVINNNIGADNIGINNTAAGGSDSIEGFAVQENIPEETLNLQSNPELNSINGIDDIEDIEDLDELDEITLDDILSGFDDNTDLKDAADYREQGSPITPNVHSQTQPLNEDTVSSNETLETLQKYQQNADSAAGNETFETQQTYQAGQPVREEAHDRTQSPDITPDFRNAAPGIEPQPVKTAGAERGGDAYTIHEQGLSPYQRPDAYAQEQSQDQTQPRAQQIQEQMHTREQQVQDQTQPWEQVQEQMQIRTQSQNQKNTRTQSQSRTQAQTPASTKAQTSTSIQEPTPIQAKAHKNEIYAYNENSGSRYENLTADDPVLGRFFKREKTADTMIADRIEDTGEYTVNKSGLTRVEQTYAQAPADSVTDGEEYSVGKSGKKYTASELEALIRD